jgi:hypothetical protein
MTVLHDNSGNPIDENNPLAIVIVGSEAIIPTDDQNRLQTTIQTHNAVSVATVAWSLGSWIDTDGFDKIAINLKNDANTSSQVNVDWSADGSTQIGTEALLSSGTSNIRSGITDTKARYARFGIYNGDTIAHTMSAWAYLKA